MKRIDELAVFLQKQPFSGAFAPTRPLINKHSKLKEMEHQEKTRKYSHFDERFKKGGGMFEAPEERGYEIWKSYFNKDELEKNVLVIKSTRGQVKESGSITIVGIPLGSVKDLNNYAYHTWSTSKNNIRGTAHFSLNYDLEKNFEEVKQYLERSNDLQRLKLVTKLNPSFFKEEVNLLEHYLKGPESNWETKFIEDSGN